MATYTLVIFSLLLQMTKSDFYNVKNSRSQPRTLTYPETAPTRIQMTKSDFYNVNNWKAQPRALIFPEQAPNCVTFIGGIGIPVEDLNFESITSGYVLKAEYFLPTKAEEFTPNYFKPQPIHRRSVNETLEHHTNNAEQRSNDSGGNSHSHKSRSSFGDNFQSKQKNASIYRWTVYKSIEMVLKSAGLAGRVCLLRSICEHAALPLQYESGLLAEILHIILTPSTSNEDFSEASDKAYLSAEIMGRTEGNCEQLFSECATSPIDQISAIFDLAE